MAVQEGYLIVNQHVWAMMGITTQSPSLTRATDASKIALDPERHTYRFFGWYEKIINRLIEHHEGQIVLGDMTKGLASKYWQSAETEELDQSGIFGPANPAHARRMIASGGAGGTPSAGMVRTRVIKKPSLYVGLFGTQQLYHGTSLAKVELPFIGGDAIRMKASFGHSAGTVGSWLWHEIQGSHHGVVSQATAIRNAALKLGKKDLGLAKKAYSLHKKIKSASVDTDDGFHLLKSKVRHVSTKETNKTINALKKFTGFGEQKMCVKLSLLPEPGMLQIPVDGPWQQQAIANFVVAMKTPSFFEKVQKHLTPRV